MKHIAWVFIGFQTHIGKCKFEAGWEGVGDRSSAG